MAERRPTRARRHLKGPGSYTHDRLPSEFGSPLPGYDPVRWAQGWARLIGIAAAVTMFLPQLTRTDSETGYKLTFAPTELLKTNLDNAVTLALPLCGLLALLAARKTNLRSIGRFCLPAALAVWLVPVVQVIAMAADGVRFDGSAWPFLVHWAKIGALAVIACAGHLAWRCGPTRRRRWLLGGAGIAVLLTLHVPVSDGESATTQTIASLTASANEWGGWPVYVRWIQALSTLGLHVGSLVAIATAWRGNQRTFGRLQRWLRWAVGFCVLWLLALTVWPYFEYPEADRLALAYGLEGVRGIAGMVLQYVATPLAMAVLIEQALPDPRRALADTFA